MQPHASQAPTFRVCGECGSALARTKTTCEVCHASSLSAREARFHDDVGTFVRIAATFRCRSCGQNSPLDSYDVDGTVDCIGCGLTQALDLDVWSQAFTFAHGLADLGRNGPREPQNPFADAGESRTSYPFATTGLRTIDGVVRTGSIQMTVAIAHPLCARCKSPLDLARENDTLHTQCGGCGATGSYRVPEGPIRIEPRPSAIVAIDARTDGAEVRVEGGAGAVAIRCPSCSASLSASPGESVIACTYCRTVCRIPSRTLHALRPKDLTPIPFFVAFRGPSTMRAQLHAAATEARRQLESSQGLEPFPIGKPTAELVMKRMLAAAIVLVLVGLAFAPRFLSVLGMR